VGRVGPGYWVRNGMPQAWPRSLHVTELVADQSFQHVCRMILRLIGRGVVSPDGPVSRPSRGQWRPWRLAGAPGPGRSRRTGPTSAGARESRDTAAPATPPPRRAIGCGTSWVSERLARRANPGDQARLRRIAWCDPGTSLSACSNFRKVRLVTIRSDGLDLQERIAENVILGSAFA
jgi:hypothetical protein